MRRREFIAALGGAAAWPLVARGQQPEPVRRIGMLTGIANDLEGQSRLGVILSTLQQRGWAVGSNLQIEVRWGTGNSDRTRADAEDLISQAPDVLVVAGTASLLIAAQATKTIPIVFLIAGDPVGAGLVPSLAHPGGNLTGFTDYESVTGGKWLELLKEIAPETIRVGILYDPGSPTWGGYWGILQSVAASLGVQPTPGAVRDVDEIERAIALVAQAPRGGLIVLPSGVASVHRETVISLAGRYKLPAVYTYRYYAAGGGLVSYGLDVVDLYQRSAVYVDRILRGEQPGELPIQQPNKFQLVINLRTAKALGLTVPPTPLARADEVIE